MENPTISQLTEQIMEIAKQKGFGTTLEEVPVSERIALIHSQISSAFEGYRNKKIKGPWSLENELAGSIFMIIQLYVVLGLNPEESLLNKIEEIKSRNWDNKPNKDH